MKLIQLDGGTREEFIDRELSLEQKLEILADYNINRQILEGNNGIEVKLSDISKRKKDAKEQFKEEALGLLEMYQAILDENKSRINKIEEDIKTDKEQIKTAENKLLEIAAKNEKSVAYAGRVTGEFNKDQARKNTLYRISSLKKDVSAKESELEYLRKVQNKYEIELKNRRTEIETFLKAQNIYAFDRNIGENNTKNEDETKEKTEQRTVTPTSTVSKPKDVAKSMFNDFMGSSPERQRKLLRQGGNEDILKMTRRLGLADRRNLKTILEQRLYELKQEEITFTADDGTQQDIRKEEFQSMKDMSEDKLKAMREELDRFNQEFSKKSIDEIDKFEAKLDYIRIATLLHEVKNPFRRIKSFISRYSKMDNTIYELAKSSARYATLKEERTTRKEAFLDRLRANVGRAPMDEYTKSSERPLDRTGADEFTR